MFYGCVSRKTSTNAFAIAKSRSSNKEKASGETFPSQNKYGTLSSRITTLINDLSFSRSCGGTQTFKESSSEARAISLSRLYPTETFPQVLCLVAWYTARVLDLLVFVLVSLPRRMRPLSALSLFRPLDRLLFRCVKANQLIISHNLYSRSSSYFCAKRRCVTSSAACVWCKRWCT